MVDVGDQTITFDFYQEGEALGFNQINYKLHEAGIYTGGLLTKGGDETHVIIGTLIAYITDTTNEVGIKVATASTITQVVSSALPFIVMRFAWSDIEDNWVEFLSVAEASILASDIIIGRCVYNSLGTVLLTTFDYTRRTVPSYLTNKSIFVDSFKVLPDEPPSLDVYISAGTCFVDGKYLDVSAEKATLSDISGSGAGNARYEIIYVDTSGTFSVLAGAVGNPAVIPDFNSVVSGYPLALIYREVDDGTGDTVTGRDITQITNQFIDKRNLETYSNTIGLGLNSYYNSGWKFKIGTGIYGGYITYETNYGGLSLYTSNATGNAGGAITGNRLVYLDNRFKNIAIGENALDSLTTGEYNIAIGKESLYEVSSSSYNIGIGQYSLKYNGGSSHEIAIGFKAGYYNRLSEVNSDTYNIYIGYEAGLGLNNTTITEKNIGIGYRALYSLSPNPGPTLGGKENIAIGYEAGYSISTSSRNICIGYQAGKTNLTTFGGIIILGDIDPSIPNNNRTFIKMEQRVDATGKILRMDTTTYEVYCDTTP